MSLVDTVVHRDESLVAYDVRCSAAAGERAEEPTVCFEVVLPLAGALWRRSSAGTSLVDAAAGYVARPEAEHEVTHVSHGDRCVVVELTPVLADELGVDAADPALPVDGDSCRRLAHALAATRAAGAVPDALAVGEAWLDVVAGLGARPPIPPAGRPGRRARHDAAVARVREAVAAEPGAPWTLRSLAAVAGYAPHHLSRVFRASTGMTVSQYRDRARLGRAMALFRDGMAGADVAAAVGYVDQAHLTRRAVQVLGARPSALREGRPRARAPMSKRSQ